MTDKPQHDKTPDQLAKELVDAMHGLAQHAVTIAHTKKVFYDAYIAEGFNPEQALELCKNLAVV